MSTDSDNSYNQFTNTSYDTSAYNDKMRIGTAPMKYYINDFNTIEGTNNPFLTYTPIGNAQTQGMSGDFERPLPSRLNSLPTTHTLNYSTTPQLGLSSNINTEQTDMDLILKTGLTLRPKNSGNPISELKYPHFGDISSKEIELSHQNAGQFYPKNLDRVYDKDVCGLNCQQNIVSQGTGVIWPIGQQIGLSSRNAYYNYAQGNPGVKCSL